MKQKKKAQNTTNKNVTSNTTAIPNTQAASSVQPNPARKPEFTWDKTSPPGEQTLDLMTELAKTTKLYRMPDNKISILESGKDPRVVGDTTDFEAFIRENVNITVIKDGKLAGNTIPGGDLKVAMRSCKLLNPLPVVDRITSTPTFNNKWDLVGPGYNPGAAGDQFFYCGQAIKPASDTPRIREFLDAMAFKSEADRTNAAAFALTVVLRHKWMGHKPFFAVTANKSHAGKDTVIQFAAGKTKKTEVSLHYRDWATQNEMVSALVDPEIGVLSIGNIRAEIIESSFLERMVTDSKLLMQSSKRRGDGYTRENDFVICASANNGRFSIDLANRSVPIDLELIGDINTRACPIGDPRHEFLPTYQSDIEAELLGMIEKWKAAGKPLEKDAKHPMREWAAVIGGILKVNGFESFLENWSMQRNINDTIREALGLIASATPPNTWVRVEDLVHTAVDEGVVNALMEPRHRVAEKAMVRQLGVVLSGHQDETFVVESDDGVKKFILRKTRNTSTGKAATVYMFETR